MKYYIFPSNTIQYLLISVKHMFSVAIQSPKIRNFHQY